MSNKKKFTKLAVLSVLGMLALTGCNESSEVYAKPSNYEDPIVTITGSEEEIHNDILEIIYDSMHDGSAPSKVLEKVLYRYAESIFGVYNNVTAKGREEVTLKEAATANYNAAIKNIDKQVSSGLMHKNTAARRKSRLTKMLNNMNK